MGNPQVTRVPRNELSGEGAFQSPAAHGTPRPARGAGDALALAPLHPALAAPAPLALLQQLAGRLRALSPRSALAVLFTRQTPQDSAAWAALGCQLCFPCPASPGAETPPVTPGGFAALGSCSSFSHPLAHQGPLDVAKRAGAVAGGTHGLRQPREPQPSCQVSTLHAASSAGGEQAAPTAAAPRAAVPPLTGYKPPQLFSHQQLSTSATGPTRGPGGSPEAARGAPGLGRRDAKAEPLHGRGHRGPINRPPRKAPPDTQRSQSIRTRGTKPS